MSLLLGGKDTSATKHTRTYCRISRALTYQSNLTPKPPTKSKLEPIMVPPKFDCGHDVHSSICDPPPQKRTDARVDLRGGFRRPRPRCKMSERIPATARGSPNPLLTSFRARVEPKSARRSLEEAPETLLPKPPRDLHRAPAHWQPRSPTNKHRVLEFALGGCRYVPLPDCSEEPKVVIPKLQFPKWFLPRLAPHELNRLVGDPSCIANQFGEETKSVTATQILGKLNTARLANQVLKEARPVVFNNMLEVNVHHL